MNEATSTRNDIAQTPTVYTAEQEQQLWTALDAVNAALEKTNNTYTDIEGNISTVSDTVEFVSTNIKEAGENIEDIAHTGQADFDSDIANINSALKDVWSTVNDLVSTVEEYVGGSSWSAVASTEEIRDLVYAARNELWKIQAEVETVLMDYFNAETSDFDNPESSVDW